MRTATLSRIERAGKSFDIPAFYSALDSHRTARHLTWKAAAAQSGVNASTFSRMAKDRSPNADGIAMLLAWSGLDVANFIPDSCIPEPLALITSTLRTDQNLSPKNAEFLGEMIKVAYQHLRKDSGISKTDASENKPAQNPEEDKKCPS